MAPRAAHAVKSVTIDGVEGPALPAYTFINVTRNHTIKVAFTSTAPSTPDAGAPTDDDVAATEAGSSGVTCNCRVTNGARWSPEADDRPAADHRARSDDSEGHAMRAAR